MSRNDSYATATVADIWGVSGVGQPVQAWHADRQGPSVSEPDEGHECLQDRLQQLRADARPDVAAAGAEGTIPTRFSVNDGDTVLRAAYTLAYSRGGMGDFTAIYGANPGITITTNRTQASNNLVTDSQGLPVLLSQTSRLGAPPLPGRAGLSELRLITDRSTSSTRTCRCRTRSRTRRRQRALNRSTALEVRYVGTRFLQSWDDSTSTRSTSRRTGSSTSSARRRRTCRPTSRPAAATRSPTPARRHLAAADLPRRLQRTAVKPGGQPGAYTGTNWTNTTFLGFLARVQPESVRVRQHQRDQRPRREQHVPAEPDHRRLSGEPFIANPDSRRRVHPTATAAARSYDSLQIELRRRLSKGLLSRATTSSATANGTRYSFRMPRECRRSTTVRVTRSR